MQDDMGNEVAAARDDALIERVVVALERAAEALSRIADTYQREHPEQVTDTDLCDECRGEFARSHLYRTDWETTICAACWVDETNGAPLPTAIDLLG